MSDEQGDLFAITDEAVTRAGRHANEQWKNDAMNCVRTLAMSGQPFLTDDVWALMEKVSVAVTHEPRALGAVMRSAQRQGVIRTTGAYLRSSRPECHTRPCAVWVGTASAAA